jgi:hypothetical protein
MDGLRLALLLALLAGRGAHVIAQTTGPTGSVGDRPDPLAAAAFAGLGQQVANQQSTDSLANGLWVGAGAGFAIGFLGAWIVVIGIRRQGMSCRLRF